jgi:hypothetical protein
VIKHVVLFKLKPGVEWNDPVTQTAVTMAGRVGDEVADLKSWQTGRNISAREIAYDFLVIGTVADEAALERYLVHPFHVEAIKLWRQISDWIMVDVPEGSDVHAV